MTNYEILKFYGDLEKEEYLFESEIGKKRLEEIESIYNEIKEFLGNLIVDIGCGAGLFTFYLEKKGFKVIGIDISKELLKEAIRTKQKFNFQSKLILGDVSCLNLKIKIDSVIIFGNTIWEFNPKLFVKIIKNIIKHASKNFYVLIQYRSLIKEIINSKNFLKVNFPYPNIAEIFEGYDDFLSMMYWRYMDLTNQKKSTSKGFATWSVGFLEAIMNSLNFELVKRIHNNTIYTDWLDIYKLINKK